MRKSAWLAVLLIVLTIVLPCSAYSADNTAKVGAVEQADHKFLRETESQIDQLFLMSGDGFAAKLAGARYDPKPILDKATNISRKGKDEYRPQALALTAKVKRLAENDPAGALKFLAVSLIGKDRAKEWEKSYDDARDAAIDKWKSDVREAKREKIDPPVKPDRVMFAAFPPVAEWSMENGNPRNAIEAGYCLLALNDRQAALSVFKTIGQKHGAGVISILAEEGGGDGFMTPGGYSDAVDLYSHALEVCRHCIGYLALDTFGDIKHYQKRIEYKLAEAKRLADIEAYGPGYCAYRECQRLRCEKKDYAEAFLAYENLAKDFPKTVFSAASEAYRLKILLALADPANEKAVEESIEKAEKSCQADELALKTAEREKAIRKNRDLRDELRESLKQKQQHLQQLKSIPLGKKAVTEAENRATAFLQDEYGLYRGEVLLDLADFWLERRFDADKSAAFYQKSEKWLEGVGDADKALSSYRVPEKAEKVSAPPRSEFGVDKFGQRTSVKPQTTDIVNRLTADWYLKELKRRVHLGLGFIHLCQDNQDEAKKHFDKFFELDQYMQRLTAKNIPNVHSRLMIDLRNGYLRFLPEELKRVRNRNRKLGFHLAEFSYESENYEKAASIYQRLLSGELGELSKDEAALATYELGSSFYMQFKFKEAVEHFAKFSGKYAGTIKAPDGLLAYGNVIKNVKDISYSKRREMASEAYQTIQKKYPKSKAAESAALFYILNAYWDKPDEGKVELQRFIKKNPDSPWVDAAKEILKGIRFHRREIDKMIKEKKEMESKKEADA